MKKLSIKEKAKAYDKALEKAKALYKAAEPMSGCNVLLETLFPEFNKVKENEDEEVKKELVAFLKETIDNVGESPNIWTMANAKKWLAWLEKQKSTDKAELKFKVGDWCIDNTDGTIFQIVRVLDNIYTYKTTNDGKKYSCTHYSLENDAHLWVIQDARPGDVLSDGTTIFIFKDLLSDGSVMSYCDYDTDSGESDAFCPLSMNLICSKITPATKEQCDTLKKAIIDAGYTFDSEKKELKKIKISPAWDSEDESRMDNLCHFLEEYGNQYYGYLTLLSTISWVKSLRPQATWKPSDEQIMALRWVLNHIPYDSHKEEISGLLEQLKKLREE